MHQPQLRLVWNVSASVPLGLYEIEPSAVPRVGDLVAVRPSPALTRFMAERRYVETNALLVKPVAALAGATVCRTNMRITLDGRAAATALPHDRFGRPLPRWSGCRRLARNQLLLIAPALRASFDSRYFGPVDRAQVIGRAFPLWTWS
ncbi:MAG: peptidase [Sphingobium sp.]|nr:peptidase [Sphingobium sp.]